MWTSLISCAAPHPGFWSPALAEIRPSGTRSPLGSCVCGPHQTLLGSTDPAFSIYIMFPAVCSATMPMIYSFIYFALCTEFAMQRASGMQSCSSCLHCGFLGASPRARKGLQSLPEHPGKPWHHSPGPQDTPRVAMRQNKEGAPSKSSSGLGRNGKGDLDKRKGKVPQLSLVKSRISLGFSHWTDGNC